MVNKNGKEIANSYFLIQLKLMNNNATYTKCLFFSQLFLCNCQELNEAREKEKSKWLDFFNGPKVSYFLRVLSFLKLTGNSKFQFFRREGKRKES